MFAEALTALAIDSTGISLQKYQEVIANQPTYKIEKSKDTYLNLSPSMKTEMSNELSDMINGEQEFISIHKKIFVNNFDKWEIEESKELLSLIKNTINGNNEINKQYLKLRKLVKKFSSLTSKIDELINLNNDITKFTNQYLTRAKEADEASKFINNFIANNQEVLKALA